MTLETGLKNKTEITVTEKDTAEVAGSGGLKVYATPRLIALCEYTSYNLVQDYLDEGKTTVGTLVNIEHLSATPVGLKVCCESELVEIDRRKLVFDLKVSDEKGLIARGRHERFIVDAEKFMAKTLAKKEENQ